MCSFFILFDEEPVRVGVINLHLSVLNLNLGALNFSLSVAKDFFGKREEGIGHKKSLGAYARQTFNSL